MEVPFSVQMVIFAWLHGSTVLFSLQGLVRSCHEALDSAETLWFSDRSTIGWKPLVSLVCVSLVSLT